MSLIYPMLKYIFCDEVVSLYPNDILSNGLLMYIRIMLNMFISVLITRMLSIIQKFVYNYIRK